MDNKIKHYSPTQTIPDMDFKPLLRGESPYYGNLNRPSQSAYDLANTVAQFQAWDGAISILQPIDQSHTFVLYQIVRITDSEVITTTTDSDNINSRYGIVVAEAEFDPTSGISSNIVVCTFCPNFIYPVGFAPVDPLGSLLYLDNTATSLLSGSASGTVTRALATKTGTNSIFFSGTAALW